MTQNEIGTLPWTMEELDFVTGPQTHVITVRVTSKLSERLDNKIRGTLWVDDVSLVPASGK